MKFKTLQILPLISLSIVIPTTYENQDVTLDYSDANVGPGPPQMNQNNNVRPRLDFGPSRFDQNFFAHNDHHQGPNQHFGSSVFHGSNIPQPITKFNNVKQSNRSPPVMHVNNAHNGQQRSVDPNNGQAVYDSNTVQNSDQNNSHETIDGVSSQKTASKSVNQSHRPSGNPPQKRGSKYWKEYNNLQAFKSKVDTFKSGDECVNGCELEVCRKSDSGDIQYCVEKICRERICARHYDRKCQNAMSRKNEYSTLSMTGCINVCGCDAIESKFNEEPKGVKQSTGSGGQSSNDDTQSVITRWIPNEDESTSTDNEDTKFVGLMDEMNSEWKYSPQVKQGSQKPDNAKNDNIRKNPGHVVGNSRIDPSVDSADGEDGPSAMQSANLYGADDTKTMQFSSSRKDEENQVKAQDSMQSQSGADGVQSGVIQSADLHDENPSDDSEIISSATSNPPSGGEEVVKMDPSTSNEEETQELASSAKNEEPSPLDDVLSEDQSAGREAPLDISNQRHEEGASSGQGDTSNERQIEEVVASEDGGSSNDDYDEDAMKKLLGEVEKEEALQMGSENGVHESPIEQESPDDEDEDFALDDELGKSTAKSKSQKKKSKVGDDDNFQLDEDTDANDNIHVIYPESTTAMSGSGGGGLIWSLFGAVGTTEEPTDPRDRIVRTEPQSGPVDQEEAKRQSRYASPTHGRISSHYFDDIRPIKVPQPPPTTTTPRPIIVRTTRVMPPGNEIEAQTVTELPPDQMAAFVIVIKKAMERGDVDEAFHRIEKENDISLSKETRKEIKRKALNEISNDASKLNSQDTTEKSVTRKESKSKQKKKIADDERKMALADEPKSHGAPGESMDIDLDYNDDDDEENEQSKNGNLTKKDDDSNIFNQDKQKSDTEAKEDGKPVDIKESTKSEFVIKDMVLEYIMTDAENETQSFKIDTTLPVPDMSEILLAEANSLGSYTALFSHDGKEDLDDVLVEVDRPDPFQESATRSPSADLNDFTESRGESTTEELPFSYGATEEAETFEPIGVKEDATKTPESDLKDIHDALDDNFKSELDDPLFAVTESESVAAYYQGETTTSVPDNDGRKLEMAADDAVYGTPNEPEEVDSSGQKVEEKDVFGQEGQSSDTSEKADSQTVVVKETASDWDWNLIFGSNSDIDNVLTDANNDSNSFSIDKSLPVPDMSEILLPEANSLSSYSVLFTFSENEQLAELLQTVDEPDESPQNASESPQAVLTPVTDSVNEEISTTEEEPFVTGELVTEENDIPTENPDSRTETPEKDLLDINFSLDSPEIESDLDDPVDAQTEGESVAAYYQGETTSILPEGLSKDQTAPVKPSEQIGEVDLINHEEQEAETIVRPDFEKTDAREATNHQEGQEMPFRVEKDATDVEFIFTDYKDDNETFIIDTSLPVPDVSELLLGDANSLSSNVQFLETHDGDDEFADILKTADHPSGLNAEVTDSPEAELSVFTDFSVTDPSTEVSAFVTGATMDDGDEFAPSIPPEERTNEEELQQIENIFDPNSNLATELDDPVDAKTEAMNVAEYYQGDTTQATTTEHKILPTAYVGLREDDDNWFDNDDEASTLSPVVEGSPKSDDYDWDLFGEEKVTEPPPPPTRPATMRPTTKSPRREPQPKPKSQITPQTESENREKPVPKPEPQYSAPQLDRSNSDPGPPPETQPEERKKPKPPPQVPRERRKTHMPSEEEEEESFWDDKPKQTNKKKPQKASARIKREDGEMYSPPATAPTAEAPDPDEGVVPDEDGGIFSDDSMISKPPKAMTKKSSSEKLNDMFQDGVRSEDHQQNEQHDSDSSSKKLDDETYGELGDGSKWYKTTNGTSKANAEVSQEDKKDTEDVDALGEDSQGRTNRFKSRKNVRERNKKLSSSSSSHTSSTTKIKGGKSSRKKGKGSNGNSNGLVSDTEVTPTTTEASLDEPLNTSTSTSPPLERRKREATPENPLKNPATVPHTNAKYSYCNANLIGTKYEAFKCRRDCYAKCSSAGTKEDQCLDVCFLLKCTLEDPGEDRDNCEAMCQKSCDSESTLQEVAKAADNKSRISQDDCDDHVTQLLYFYGEFREEMMNEYCSNVKARRKR